MTDLFARSLGMLVCLAAATGLADPADAATLLISGGTATQAIPQGSSGNSVLEQAGIGVADGGLWIDATLRNEGDITLTLYDVGSESAWKDQIQLNNSTTNATVWDNDDHKAGTSGIFVNGSAPFQRVKSFTQKSGITSIRFLRADPKPSLKLVVNGQSPTSVPGFGYASIAFAYLDDAYQVVGHQTNRILVMLEDGNGLDLDYDDYVGILEGPPLDPPPPPPNPAVLSISGGTPVSEIPQGNSGSSVLGQAGIGLAGGPIWLDGTLDVLGNGALLTLYDVGSESHWINEIRLGSDPGSQVVDWDDHFRGDSGDFTNGSPPFQVAGSALLGSGVASFEFWRRDPTPEYQIVVNGQSPMMMVPGYGYASIALAYLSEANQIVNGPTDRILVLLEDGGTDRDYDDYVGILAVSASPPTYPISPNALVFGPVPRNTSSVAKLVTVTNYGSVPLPVGAIKVKGANAAQFTRSTQCPASLPVGGSCTISVVFIPASKGSKTATLNITAGGLAYVVGLFGTGT